MGYLLHSHKSSQSGGQGELSFYRCPQTFRSGLCYLSCKCYQLRLWSQTASAKSQFSIFLNIKTWQLLIPLHLCFPIYKIQTALFLMSFKNRVDISDILRIMPPHTFLNFYFYITDNCSSHTVIMYYRYPLHTYNFSNLGVSNINLISKILQPFI